MGTNYPGALDAWTNPTSTTKMNDTGFEHDLVHSDVFDAIEAIEAELGTDPAGSQATVRARLEDSALHGSPTAYAWASTTYACNVVGANTAGTLATAVNTVYYCPWFCPLTATVDRAAVEVTTAQVGANARLGLYGTTTNGMPGDLIVDFGEVDCSTTGVKELTVSQAVTGGRPYWLALLNETASVSYRAPTSNATRAIYMTTTATAVSGVLSESRTYGSGLLSTAGTSLTLSANPTFFWLRRS